MSGGKQYLVLILFAFQVAAPRGVYSFQSHHCFPPSVAVSCTKNGLPPTQSQQLRRIHTFLPSCMKHRIGRHLPSVGTVALKMGAFGGKRNKQAELQRKLEQAKKQQQTQDQQQTPLSAEEIKIRNDKKRFEDLLNSESATAGIMDEFKDGSYMTKRQEEEELTSRYGRGVKTEKAAAIVNKIYEGDPASPTPFENLVHWKSEKALGTLGTERILPWVNPKSPEKAKDYVVVVCDPRSNSVELRQTIKTLEKCLPKDILDRMLVINADSPLDNRKYAKKQGISKIEFYSDEKREWMREYSALGSKRWSINVFVLADGKVQKLVRELDPYFAEDVVVNAIKSLEI